MAIQIEFLERQDRLDREREERQEKREREDRDWRERQEEISSRRHKEALTQASKQHWRELVVGMIIVTIIMVATTIAAAFIERNSWFKDPQIESPAAVPDPASPAAN